MNELQLKKRAFVAGAKWAFVEWAKCASYMYGTHNDFIDHKRKLAEAAAKVRYTPKPTCEDCQFQFDNPFDQSFCKKGFNATRVCKQFKKRGAK